jgi:hypothetical protein
MSQDIAGVYSDARLEYTKQLYTILVPSYFQFFLTMLEKAKVGTEPKKVLWQFQTLLNDIPEWNMEKVNTEITQLQASCGCDYLDDLLTAVFIAHTKVLTAIRISSKQKRVQITVPKVEHFLFKVLCETSKLLWGSSYLFREGISSIEKQQNYRSIEGLLGEGILQAVRQMVPVKNILRDFVSMEDGEDEETKETKDEETKEAKAEEVHVEEEAKVEEPKVEEVKPAEPVLEEVKVEEVKPAEPVPEEVKVEEVKPEGTKVEEASVPQIVIDTTRHVGFSDYKSVFDSSDPDHSDIVLDQVGEEEDYDLDILDGPSEPLDLSDAESLDAKTPAAEQMTDTDYDVLV